MMKTSKEEDLFGNSININLITKSDCKIHLCAQFPYSLFDYKYYNM